MRLIALTGLLLLTGLLQGCFPNAFKGGEHAGLVAEDRRTGEARIDDREIEKDAADLIYRLSDAYIRVNVTSFNHKVLVSGEVPNEVIKGQVEKSAQSVSKVSEVFNELTVGANSSLLSRSNDSRLTSNVKLKFVADERFDSNQVRVVVENGTVFLMGLVYRHEAEAAAETASGVKGVQQVVKLFEYLN